MNVKDSDNFQRHYAMMVSKDGTSQADRLLAALQDDFCQVDDLSPEALLAIAAEYARLIRFYGPDNSEDGDWVGFFKADEAVLLSMILTTNVKPIAAEFDRFLSAIQHRSASRLSEYQQSEIPNYVIAKKIDHWFCQLQSTGGEAGQNLGGKIASVIKEKLRRELFNFRQLLKLLNQNSDRLSEQFRQDFHPFWFASDSRFTAADTEIVLPNHDEIALRTWEANFYVFHNAVLFLQSCAKDLLPDALKSQRHDPGIGLYIAFIGLRQKVQHKLNNFTPRHRQFYYHEVLQMRSNKAVADSTYLVLNTDTSENKIPLAAGTEFIAHINKDNREVIYAADHELMVSGAAVQQIYTLYWERNPLIAPENSLSLVDKVYGTRQLITAAKINRIPVSPANPSRFAQKQSVYPIFGAAKTVAEQRDFLDAQLGFAIASPVLLLKEGERNIDLTISSQNSSVDENTKLEAFIDQLADILRQEKSENELVYREDAFFKAFQNIFTIQLTVSQGWYAVAEYLPLHAIIDPDCPKNDLKIQIQLSAKVPAIVPYVPDIHGPGFDTDQPVIRILINPGAYLYPYSLLQNLQVRKISLEVKVKGVRDFSVSNHLGPLSPQASFQPFGPIPAPGSYFMVGSAEAAVKQISRFDLNIEWAGLPVEHGGFKQYYRAYGEPFDNEIFEAQLSVLNGGQWLPWVDDKKPRLKLFRTDADQNGEGLNRINKSQRLSCQKLVKDADPIIVGNDTPGFDYTTSSKAGFFKFTLSNPTYAFGHQAYPLKLAEVLTFNGKIKSSALHKAIPNPPYTPQINAITLDYQATTTIDFEQLSASGVETRQDRVFHIHPFGWQNLATAADRSGYLLPRYQDAGNLFIGLSAKDCSGALSLLFHLAEDSLSHLSEGDPQAEFSWYYLSSNQWQQLDKRQVIADTTQGFLTSGAVILDLPADINRDNSIMPDGLLWLRVSGESHLNCLCSVYGIYAQGLKVSCKVPDNSTDDQHQPLPPGSITASKVSIPGIASISQVTASFAGRAAEHDRQLTIRSSERLKHKNRASTAWDYERLILEQFPEIFKVKCFANMVAAEDPQQRIRPGHVLIVVIPRLTEQSKATLQPMVNDLLLLEIAGYVKTIASPLVKITVRNPTYEKIQIRFAVEFSRGKNNGYYINALNQAICDYLSPWEPGGYSSRFGWCIRSYDLESYLGKFEYVDFITKFSMLQLTENDAGHFKLFDTGSDHASKDLHPVYPWGIAVPLQRNFIQGVNQETYIKSELAGIGDLAIGRTLIIAERQDHGEEN